MLQTWKTWMLTAGLAAQFACGGPASDTPDTLEQPQGVALTGSNAVQRLDTAPLAKGVDVTALVALNYHSLALAPTLQGNALFSPGSASSIIQTSDGGYAFTGTFKALGTDDILLVKLDAFLNVQWAYAYGTSNAESGVEVRQTSDGGFMIAGQIFQNATTNFDFYLVRTDSTGNPYWQLSNGGTLHEYATAMEVTPDGGCIIVGKTQSNLGYQNAYMVKFSSVGAVQWSRSFSSGDSGTYEFRGVANVPGGGYVAVGSRQVKVSSSTWETFGYAVKVNSAGSTLFEVSSGRFAGLEAVTATSTGYVAVGYIYPVSGADFYAVRFSPTGGTLWAWSLNAGTNGDYLSDVKLASDGNYVVTGTISPTLTQQNLRLMKLDNSGIRLWDFYPYASTVNTNGQSLAITSDGGFINSGGYTDSTNTWYLLLSKFSP
ncbi:hypothetical protein [Hyalangium minutum]|uniref:hypothetical protein n=1 Tax=Hyalangium minutum TaxID=394096 RepID=UPI0012F97AEA|nr:hypothetical protein [Hyalangium minutum]